ncbi:MAG: GHKL domain-containing protein [Ruminococcus sp.]|nr:GHKL domain-containing protein [Ruminococcus sp.]
MHITAYNLIYIISNLFNVYTVKLFMDKYLEINPKYKKLVFVGYGTFFLITTLLYFIIDIPAIMMIANILCFFGISLFYKGDIKNKIIASFYIYIVVFVVEILVTVLTFTPFISPLEKYGYTNILGLFINKILQFFTVLLLRNVFIKRNKSNDDVLPLKISISSLLIPILTIIVETIVISTPNISQNKVVLSVVVLFMINFVAFVLYNSLLETYNNKMKNVILNQEREYYYKQCSIMQKAVESTQSFRHDFNNHMLILNDFIANGNISSAEQYLKSLQTEHQKYNSVYSATGNIAIDSILNYKLNGLSDKNIDINIEVNVPTEFSVEIMDISTILTNLLDNAAYALDKAKNEKILNIRILYRKGMLIISISNSYNGIVLYENGEIVTTKNNKAEHGKGVANIRKTIEKYNGLLKFTHDESIFTSEILLYVS